MSEPTIPAAVRERVRTRAGGRCEYCQSRDDFSPSPFGLDHIWPVSLGGSDNEDNLAWCCGGCNNAKYTAVSAIDPREGKPAPLYHPRKDNWIEHFDWIGGAKFIYGLTPVGRATIARLQMNRAELLNIRQVLVVFGKHPPNVELE